MKQFKIKLTANAHSAHAATQLIMNVIHNFLERVQSLGRPPVSRKIRQNENWRWGGGM